MSKPKITDFWFNSELMELRCGFDNDRYMRVEIDPPFDAGAVADALRRISEIMLSDQYLKKDSTDKKPEQPQSP